MAKKTDNPRIDERYGMRRAQITKRFMHAVAHVIQYRRKDCKNMTQVARAIEAVPQNMSRYYSGQQDVTIEQVAIFCDYFGVNDSYILRGVGNLEEMMPTNQRIDKIEAQVMELQKQIDLVLSQRKN